jgi:hypothetical protein
MTKSIVTTTILAALFMVFLGTQSLSAQVQEQVRQGIPGTVTTYDGTTLTIERTRPGETGTVDVRVTEATQVTGTIEVGSRVAVLAQQTNGELEAVYVVVRAAVPAFSAATGVVVSIENNVLTIMLPNGDTRTLQASEGMEVPPAGELVTVFARVMAGAGPDTPPQVTGLRTAAQVQARLETQLQRLMDNDPGLPPAALHARERLLSRLADGLEEHARLRLQILQGTCDRICDNQDFPVQARDQLRDQAQEAERDRDRIGDRAQQARGADPGGTPGGPSGNSPGRGGPNQ